jgi:membrane-bound metal-dependent hydrolase YbcI (DUF457 family)
MFRKLNMPSPIGHALAGFTLGLLAERPANSPTGSTGPQPLLTRLTVFGALFAALPDADLLFAPVHRGWTHSFGASLLILIVAAVVTGQVNRVRRVREVRGVHEAWRLALVLSLAQASHVVLDWMGTDHSTPGGLQALWPVSREFYMSGWDFFPETERNFAKPEIIAMNAWALCFELVVLGPIALVAMLFTRRRRSRARISGRDDPRPPSA